MEECVRRRTVRIRKRTLYRNVETDSLVCLSIRERPMEGFLKLMNHGEKKCGKSCGIAAWRRMASQRFLKKICGKRK
jgi:hypothetical protein